ncbi:MAG TPA: VOC family protein [Beijerinckiaceae bacterium]|jgi:catechol 2,3-dioxygenase-like lactoylglutathione lyase family enzyme
MSESAQASGRHAVVGMDHFTVLTPDVAVTRAFYEGIGFVVGPRPPDLPGAGLWLYVGERPILHVVGPVKAPESPRGLLDHMAFRAANLPAFAALLTQKGVPYRLTRLADPFGVWQLFFEDPFGARVEFDFDGEETAPAGWSPMRGES